MHPQAALGGAAQIIRFYCCTRVSGSCFSQQNLILLLFHVDNHSHSSAKHFGGTFELSAFFHRRKYLFHDLITPVYEHHLTSPEQHRKLDLMPLFDELDRVIDLDLQVMLVDLRPEPNLF